MRWEIEILRKIRSWTKAMSLLHGWVVLAHQVGFDFFKLFDHLNLSNGEYNNDWCDTGVLIISWVVSSIKEANSLIPEKWAQRIICVCVCVHTVGLDLSSSLCTLFLRSNSTGLFFNNNKILHWLISRKNKQKIWERIWWWNLKI